LPRRGTEISICGQLFHTGARVVLWNDPAGYDAYRLHRRFDPDEVAPRDAPHRTARFGSFRRGLPDDLAARVRADGWRLEDLRETVTQILIHYDACGSSRRCFEVLHDIRGLSSQFLLDTDGTIFQTLDVKERAWHAGIANDRSVGIEIANLGAYPVGDHPEPSEGMVTGEAQGSTLVQSPFTDAQYEALGRLAATLCRVLDVPAVAPRGEDGRVATGVIGADESRDFRGLLGHQHVYATKVDPGPAFDWERLFRDLARHGVE